MVTEFFLFLLLFIRQVLAGNEVHFADHLMQSLFYNLITFIIAHSKLNGKVIASQREEILLDVSSTSIDGAICRAVCFASVENAEQYVLPFARCKDLLTVAKLQRRKGSIQDTQADTHTHTRTHQHT